MLFSPYSFQSPLCCPRSGTRFQPQSHPEPSSGIKTARSRRKPQNSLQRLTLVLFVKVLNLPTNPCPLNGPWGSCTKGDQCRPLSYPSTCGGGTVAWGTPVFVHGATSFSPCDTAVEFNFFSFCFVGGGGCFCSSVDCFGLLCFMGFGFDVPRFGLGFPFSLEFIYSCFEPQSY